MALDVLHWGYMDNLDTTTGRARTLGEPVREDWYRLGFRHLYAVVYAHRTVEAAAPEAAFAAKLLGLRQGERVLDAGCGNGRHLVHLARMTKDAAGLDYSVELLATAAAQLNGAARLVRGDLRRLPFGPCFDAVASFFTTFGYFPTDVENGAAAAELARVLKPGGRWFLDFLNAANVRQTLEPETLRHNGDYAIHERRWIDEARGRVNKRVEVTHRGHAAGSWEESVRLYDQAQLCALLADAGLAVEEVFGNYSGESADAEQPRLIMAGRKR